MSVKKPQRPHRKSQAKLSRCSNGSPTGETTQDRKPEAPQAIEQSPLYGLTSERRLAKFLFCTPQALRKLLRLKDSDRFRIIPHTETRRVYDSNQKQLSSTTKQRELQIPTGVTESIHRRIHDLLNRIERPDYLHSGTRGRSYVSGARVHRGAAAIAKADIKRFFPSVKRVHIYNFFVNRMRCAPDIAGRLASLCTYQGCLPTGSAVSQILAFWTFKALFDEFAQLAQSCGLKMTLYVDDLVVSGNTAGREFLLRVRRAARRHGLKLHKLRVWSGGIGHVTGVVIAGQELRLPNLRRLVIQDELHNLQALRSRTGFNALQRRERLLKRLVGKCWEAGQFDSSFKVLGTQLNNELNRIRRRIEPSLSKYSVSSPDCSSSSPVP